MSAETSGGASGCSPAPLARLTGHPRRDRTEADSVMANDLANDSRERRASPASAAAKAGIGFGTALAITISWTANKSVLWAIIHGVLSWIYVVYYVLKES